MSAKKMSAETMRKLVDRREQQEEACRRREEKKWEPYVLEGKKEAKRWFQEHCLPVIQEAASKGHVTARIFIGLHPYHWTMVDLRKLEGRKTELKKILRGLGYTIQAEEMERLWLYDPDGVHDWDDVVYNEKQFLVVCWTK